VGAWAGVIFAASSIPGSDVPGRFGSLAHFAEYAIFGALLRLALSTGTQPDEPSLGALSIASAYGVTDEVHQAFVPMRTPDPVDWIIDSVGAMAGIGLMAAVLRRRARREDQ
jgi:VanZ family protein